ncbi:hypothetical protein JK386_17225 [Nocardioides sp. zg-536]|uniref:Uncharacterized protein n=1 Tax=Nocardioides faecalis TaxID=2803858 RepID=A0A938Y986_9ACTN|nr:hypothetical protein [Nocardioides faecalis]MBM9461645.1 hypothetical protein [Nocardioides faecalis]QVI59916.1 hypothetical protein KG111_06260 [Nocardioides faecalis]
MDATYRNLVKGAETDFVYVALSRGVEVIDRNGEAARPEGAPSTITSVNVFDKALPLGTRVVVMGEQWAPPARGEVVAPSSLKHPAAPVARGGHPQTFALETEDGGIMSGWPDYTFNELTRAAEEGARG